MVSTLLAVVYAWRTGDTIRPGQFLALIYSTGAFLVSAKLVLTAFSGCMS
ncbi:hypothetical protein ULG90_02845 [Halopseudomonas pachastrellae]|nr:hypothetical protein ULG90_02845 [Halopseudomonas pachastrellae]